VFNARTFFQVGPVQPSRQNQFGARVTGGAGKLGDLTAAFSQRHVRGMVNGNVLVPLPDERTALATDPAVRAIVNRYLAAYPKLLPNRPDFDERALNTNAPQRIDETDGSLRLDRPAGKDAKLLLSYVISRQRVKAFQLVAGQNPDTDIHNHRARITWHKAFSAATTLAAGASFQRNASDLRPEPNAVGARVRMGYQIEELGPDSHFPIHRATNSFRYGAVGRSVADGGRHQFTFGGDFTRFQLNGIETNNTRGLIWFTSNFGRTAIDNLRTGTATTYEATLGELSRGFRNASANLFWADQWKVNSRLQLYYGLRYNLETAPFEVNGYDRIPYSCDCNNFSPRFSIAYQLPQDWMLRTSYTVSFGQIQPVTYQQVRYNPPNVRYVQVQNPDLLNLLGGAQNSTRTSPHLLSPDLVSPYVHQYNFTLERRFSNGYIARWGYVGSRTIKLLNVYIQNRGDVVPGVPLTTATVDQRRPDARYYEIKHLLNAGIAYLDEAQFNIEAPSRRGLAWGATYTFGKALDEGSDYAATAANRDLSSARAQSQYESLKDRKGLSNFDSTHAVLFYYSYDLPKFAPRRIGWLMNNWQAAGSTLIKSGTPLTLYIGSDAPGFGNVDGGPSDRPNIVDPSILGMTISNPDVAPGILRRDRFAFLVPGQLRGTLGRGAFRKGGIANFNGALTKRWRWGGARERSLQFRAEAFNLTNHPQFDEPNRNLNASAFGKITNALNDGRILQLGLRFTL
jgi:hypothetical protein